MIKRTSMPPLPPGHPNYRFPTQTDTAPPKRIFVRSPPPALYVLARNPKEELQPRTSSLNQKLKRRNFEEGPGDLVGHKPVQGSQKKIGQQLNGDFKQAANIQKLNHQIKRSSQSHTILPPSYSFANKFATSPELPMDYTKEPENTQQMSEQSTSSSQFSDRLHTQSLQHLPKQVRFGEVIDATETKACFKKKQQKARSPSILKSRNRNILNCSIVLSADKDRSQSAVSCRSKRDKDKRAQVQNTNQVIKQKYKSILSNLQAQFNGCEKRSNRFSAATYSNSRLIVQSPQKYKDIIFPPAYSSLFVTKKNKTKRGEELSWKRISDVFAGKQLVLAKLHYNDMWVVKSAHSYAQNFLISAFNALRGSPKLLQKMFQNQDVSPYGIYLVKIFQNNIWKYIIIDDYIPVFKTKQGQYEPAFLNVHVQNKCPIDIWPFLLQKAYANYYSRYQALQFGKDIDFAQEITGTPSKKFVIMNDTLKKSPQIAQEAQTALNNFKKEIALGETVAIGTLKQDKGHIPLVYDSLKKTLIFNDPMSSYRKREITFPQLQQICKSVNLISPFKYGTTSGLTIRNTKHGKRPPPSKNLIQVDHPYSFQIDIACPSQYTFSIRQRQSRHFYFNQDLQGYIWRRVILLQKENQQENGYRWIDGEYSNKKSINFTHFLQEGTYNLLVETQWQVNCPNEVILQISGPSQCNVQRVAYLQSQRIIESGCMDLAQRYGQLSQINKCICSYNFLTEKVGFIIQNIINQRIQGQVSVMRSIKGLKCAVQILPINPQFYQRVQVQQNQYYLKLKDNIQLQIPKGKNYTVVLKLKGGNDKKFWRTFDFSCS